MGILNIRDSETNDQRNWDEGGDKEDQAEAAAVALSGCRT
jgi:hypothetical protein